MPSSIHPLDGEIRSKENKSGSLQEREITPKVYPKPWKKTSSYSAEQIQLGNKSETINNFPVLLHTILK